MMNCEICGMEINESENLFFFICDECSMALENELDEVANEVLEGFEDDYKI